MPANKTQAQEGLDKPDPGKEVVVKPVGTAPRRQSSGMKRKRARLLTARPVSFLNATTLAIHYGHKGGHRRKGQSRMQIVITDGQDYIPCQNLTDLMMCLNAREKCDWIVLNVADFLDSCSKAFGKKAETLTRWVLYMVKKQSLVSLWDFMGHELPMRTPPAEDEKVSVQGVLAWLGFRNHSQAGSGWSGSPLSSGGRLPSVKTPKILAEEGRIMIEAFTAFTGPVTPSADQAEENIVTIHRNYFGHRHVKAAVIAHEISKIGVGFDTRRQRAIQESCRKNLLLQWGEAHEKDPDTFRMPPKDLSGRVPDFGELCHPFLLSLHIPLMSKNEAMDLEFEERCSLENMWLASQENDYAYCGYKVKTALIEYEEAMGTSTSKAGWIQPKYDTVIGDMSGRVHGPDILMFSRTSGMRSCVVAKRGNGFVAVNFREALATQIAHFLKAQGIGNNLHSFLWQKKDLCELLGSVAPGKGFNGFQEMVVTQPDEYEDYRIMAMVFLSGIGRSMEAVKLRRAFDRIKGKTVVAEYFDRALERFQTAFPDVMHFHKGMGDRVLPDDEAKVNVDWKVMANRARCRVTDGAMMAANELMLQGYTPRIWTEDEIVLEGRLGELAKIGDMAQKVLAEAMETVLGGSLPLHIEVLTGTRWGEMELGNL